MKLKKFIAVLGVAAMMTGLLAGCGNSADEGNADGGKMCIRDREMSGDIAEKIID